MKMWKKIAKLCKRWWLKRKIRREIKRMNREQLWKPPIGRSVKSEPFFTPKTAQAVILDEFAKIPLRIEAHLETERVKSPDINASDSKLPTRCPNCDNLVTPSLIDDRVAGCTFCKMMFLTQAAHDDPNIQRDITHANAGITPKQTKVQPDMEKIRGMGAPIYSQEILNIWHMRRENEINQARAFGEGYTRGKYNMSREEFNKKKQEEDEKECQD